jgi:predicted lipoprotein with Yx(FWY)xxD motif
MVHPAGRLWRNAHDVRSSDFQGKKMSRRLATAFLLCLSVLPLAHSADLLPSDPPIRQRGGILVDAKGRGLYTFDKDVVPGRSECNNQCRLLWPPLMADPAGKPKGPFTIIQRQDGSQQWAYLGKPLYRWASDKGRGDAGGAKVTNWRLVTVSPPPIPPAPGTAAPAAKPAPAPAPKPADGKQ